MDETAYLRTDLSLPDSSIEMMYVIANESPWEFVYPAEIISEWTLASIAEFGLSHLAERVGKQRANFNCDWQVVTAIESALEPTEAEDLNFNPGRLLGRELLRSPKYYDRLESLDDQLDDAVNSFLSSSW